MSKTIKSIMMRDYKDRIGDTSEAIVISVSGLKAKDTTKLRTSLKKKNIRITVVRNSLARKLFEGTTLAPLNGLLTGSSALIYGPQSVVEVAREFVAAAKEFPNLEMKGALLEGTLFSGKAGVEELSRFPTRVEAIGDLMTLIVGPGRKLAAQIKGPGSTVAGLVKSIESKLEKGEAIAKIA